VREMRKEWLLVRKRKSVEDRNYKGNSGMSSLKGLGSFMVNGM